MNGKLRVCIDFRDLNKATPMDGYPMPIADMLVLTSDVVQITHQKGHWTPGPLQTREYSEDITLLW
jgi:hypothetical protein